MEHLEPSVGSSHCEWKGRASYFDVTTEERMERRAAWFYPDPTPPFAGLEDHVAFYPFQDGRVLGRRAEGRGAGRGLHGVGSPDIVGPFKAPPAPGAGRYTVDASSLRKEYTRAGLDRADLDPDPIVQFQEWFEKVIDADLHEPNAMIVSTASTDGEALCPHRPSQGLRRTGLRVLYQLRRTQSQRDRGRPHVRPTFLLGRAGTAGQDRGPRQPSLEGMSPTPTSRAVPREPSRGVGFEQSRPVEDRSVLEEQVKALEAQYEGVRSHAPFLGRLPGRARRHRVLAGARE